MSNNTLRAFYKLSMKYLKPLVWLRFSSIATLIIFVFSSLTLFGQGNPDKGKDLFKANCAACHNKNMKDKLTGPALGVTLADWSAYPHSDLLKWVKNSQGLIAEGHPRALELWNQYKPVVMTSFPTLADQDIEDILSYIDGVAKGTYGVPAVVPGAATAIQSEKPENTNWVYWVLFAVFGLVVVVLSNIIRNLNSISKSKDQEIIKEKTLLGTLTSKKMLGLIILAMIVLGSFTTVQNAIHLGRQQNYQPTQPINFSHKIHAGDNKIDCNFCHDGARRSKQSIIPGASTCMSCHKAVKKGTLSGTSEITKIYASIGFNPLADTFITHYDKLPEKEVEQIYQKWITDQYIDASSATLSDASAFARNQWSDIVKSMTSNTKSTVKGPIEWVRIHNLPDHVYFNHSQHVTVAGLDCAKCHGKVQEMDVVRQYSPLSMGWCINCHRETEVKFADNPYYDSYINYHKEIKEGKRSKVTVEDIGGLECQKCHY